MKALKQILHGVLALVLVVSTMGVTLHKHYCMGMLKQVAINQQAQSCMKDMGLEEGNKECPKSCCEDVEEEYKIDDLNKIAFEFKLKTDFHFIADIQQPIADFQPALITTYSSDLNYRPPPIEVDRPVYFQSFLL